MSKVWFTALATVFWLSGTAMGFQEGIYVASWHEGQYQRAVGGESLQALSETGAEWVAVTAPSFQQDAHSTEIFRAGTDLNTGRSKRGPSEEDVTAMVRWAHGQGLKVMLVPHVKVLHPEQWKGEIEFDDEVEWSAWFSAYRDHMLGHARLAQRLGVEQLSMGNELRQTSHRESEWRELIAAVRGVFRGRLTYAAHHDEVYRIRWWDALDFIGIDAYWDLVGSDTPTVAEIKRAWAPHAARLKELAARWGRQVIFTEVGFRSVNGAAQKPWRYDDANEVDLQEQADAYQATFEEFFQAPWVAGTYWWAWDIQSNGGASDRGYTPQGKPAEEVLRAFYGGERQPEDFAWIYRDGHENGWSGQRWKAGVDEAAPVGRFGSPAVRAELEALGGVSFAHPGLDLGAYGALELLYRGPADAELGVSIESAEGELMAELKASRRGEDGGWTRVVVPFQGLGAGAVRIHVQDLSASGASFVLDEVRLLAGDGEEPPRGPDIVAALTEGLQQLGRLVGLGGQEAQAPREEEPRNASGLLGALGRGR